MRHILEQMLTVEVAIRASVEQTAQFKALASHHTMERGIILALPSDRFLYFSGAFGRLQIKLRNRRDDHGLRFIAIDMIRARPFPQKAKDFGWFRRNTPGGAGSELCG